MVWYMKVQAIFVHSVLKENISIRDQITFKGTASLQSLRSRTLTCFNCRHVCENHMDVDMNDPRLREVFSQRSEGGSNDDDDEDDDAIRS